MEAVGAYVYDGAPPPPVLLRAFDYRTFGVNVLDLPAGEVRAVSAAYNIYSAISAYRGAAAKHKAAEWAAANPDAYRTVSEVLRLHFRRQREQRA